MKKTITIIGLIIVFIIISVGAGILIFKTDDNKVDEKYEQLKKDIVTEFDTFKAKVSTISKEQNTVKEEIDSIEKLTDISDKYDEIILEYQNYEKLLKDLDESSKLLKENCHDINFDDKNVNNKLEAFVDAYEKAFYNYISYVEILNKRISEYNDWVENTQVTDEYKKLDEYISEYKEYSDINGDGNYDGIEK